LRCMTSKHNTAGTRQWLPLGIVKELTRLGKNGKIIVSPSGCKTE
jgi:hypothetical protein